jgi:hypothetical protein
MKIIFLIGLLKGFYFISHRFYQIFGVTNFTAYRIQFKGAFKKIKKHAKLFVFLSLKTFLVF